MQCYMHTLWCMVPVHHTLDLECTLMIASIVQLLIVTRECTEHLELHLLM